jgi:hypothetical protein
LPGEEEEGHEENMNKKVIKYRRKYEEEGVENRRGVNAVLGCAWNRDVSRCPPGKTRGRLT